MPFCAGLFQGKIRHALNEKLTAKILSAQAASTCPQHEPSNSAQPIIWSDSKLFGLLDTVVNEKLGASGVNKLLDCITNGTGSIAISTKSWDIALTGLNSFYNLTLLEPFTPGDADYLPYNLKNTIALGGPTPLQIVLTAKSNTTTPIELSGWESDFLSALLPRRPVHHKLMLPALPTLSWGDEGLGGLGRQEGGQEGEDEVDWPLYSEDVMLGGFLPAGTEVKDVCDVSTGCMIAVRF